MNKISLIVIVAPQYSVRFLFCYTYSLIQNHRYAQMAYLVLMLFVCSTFCVKLCDVVQIGSKFVSCHGHARSFKLENYGVEVSGEI